MAKDDKTQEAPTALSEDERAELELLREQVAATNEANARGTVASSSAGADNMRRRTLELREAAVAKAERDKRANVEVTIRPGREVFTELGQKEPHRGGSTILVTPEEEAQLRAAGHLIGDDGTLLGPTGPQTFRDTSLIQGHGPGQGTPAADAKSGGKSGK